MSTDRLAAPGPMPVAERALGPDLARGVMLAFIALANSHYFLRGSSYLGGFPLDGGALDSVVAWAISTFVDGRAFPMFDLLFGYGVAQIVRRRSAPATPGPAGGDPPGTVRRLLWRRSAVLIVVGFLHAMLLYIGDILAAYGVLLLLGAWAVRWRDRTLLLVAAVFLVLNALPGGSLSSEAVAPDPAMIPPDPIAALKARIVVQPLIMLLGPIGFACPFLFGLWAGRRRVLEYPERHRRLLLTTAAVGLAVAVIGAQPVALVLAGVRPVPDPATLDAIGTLHDATGVLGGFGYAALIALLAERLTLSALVRAVAATGQRSMTCYLMQSVVWTVVFTPFLADLSGTLSVAGTAALALGTWTATVVAADRMRAAGYRGPFELLVRRVSYGRPQDEPRRRPTP